MEKERDGDRYIERGRKCSLGFFVWRISCFGDGERRSGRQPADQGEFLRRRSGEAEGEFDGEAQGVHGGLYGRHACGTNENCAFSRLLLKCFF